MDKKGEEFLNQVVIHLVIFAIIVSLFLFATADKINGRGVRQQVIEKQTALLIDSAVPGMEFKIKKTNANGFITSMSLGDGVVRANVDGLVSLKGYPYFSRHNVYIEEKEGYFLISVHEK